MSFVDIIKKSVLENFTGTISVGDIILSLLTAFIIGIFIVYIYRKTYTGVVYSKSFSLCLILLCMVTALIIRTINSNLSLSLGMVGALSIVRFRTAIKEPVDTVFMFFAITMGIMSGAGIYLIAILASILVGVLYFVSYMMGFRVSSQYLLVLKYNVDYDSTVTSKIKQFGKNKLKSKSITGKIMEVSYEIEVKENIENVLKVFSNDEKIINASLISYQNDFGA